MKPLFVLTFWFSTHAAGRTRRWRARQHVNAHNESWEKFHFLCISGLQPDLQTSRTSCLCYRLSYFFSHHFPRLQLAVMLAVYTCLLNGSTNWLWAADTTPCYLPVMTQLMFPLQQMSQMGQTVTTEKQTVSAGGKRSCNNAGLIVGQIWRLQ